MVGEAPIRSEDFALARKLQWLALSLTPGVGAGKGRKLVEAFGGIERVFAASLTELEAAGLPARRRRASLWASRWSLAASGT